FPFRLTLKWPGGGAADQDQSARRRQRTRDGMCHLFCEPLRSTESRLPGQQLGICSWRAALAAIAVSPMPICRGRLEMNDGTATGTDTTLARMSTRPPPGTLRTS